MSNGRKKDDVYGLLLERLSSGHYQFGERILAKKVSEETGASRFVVISALNELRAQGFVNIFAQVGCEVVRPSREEVHDFFVMLSRLEGVLAEFAAERAPEYEIPRAHAINAGLQNLQGDYEEQGERYRLVNAEFHALIHVWARSPLLAEKQAINWAMADFLVTHAADFREHAGDSAQEHDAVVKAIAARDTEAARQLMEKHVLLLGEEVLRHLDASADTLAPTRAPRRLARV